MTDPASSATSPLPRSLFRDGAFLRLWAIGSLLMATRWLEILATSVFVFAVTDSAMAVALVNVARAVPNLLFGALTGAIADRIDRRSLLVGGQVVIAVVSGVLWLLAVTGEINPWFIALGGFVNGIVFSSEFPVRRALMADIAGVDRVGRAMGLDLTANNATRVVGPALGGLVYETLGIDGIFMISAGVYVFTFVLAIGIIQPPRIVAAVTRNVFQSIGEGLRYVRSDRALMGTMAVTIIMNIWGFPYANMVPVLGREELNLTAFPVGLLVSGEGVGALAGSLLVATYARQPHFSKLYLYGTYLLITCGLLFSLSRLYEVSLVITFLGGFGVAGFTTMQATLPYLLSPPEMRARVMGVLSVCVGTGPLGLLNLGLMSEWFGAANALTISGIQGLIAITVAVVIWREIR